MGCFWESERNTINNNYTGVAGTHEGDTGQLRGMATLCKSQG